MEIRRPYILCEWYFRSSVARWWRRGRHPPPRTRIRKAGAGHALALIINYSGRFGSRLGNEVIFLPGRRQRRRHRHCRLLLGSRLRLCHRRHPTSPLSCSHNRGKVFTHVTTWSPREIRYAKRQTPSSVYYACTLSRPILASPANASRKRTLDRRRYLFKKNPSGAIFQSQNLGKYRYERIRRIWGIL